MTMVIHIIRIIVLSADDINDSDLDVMLHDL